MTIDRQKYLFDLNNFDESAGHQKIEEDLPPPPPVFSTLDMEQAEQRGYERGREAAMQEAQVSREQYIATQIGGFTGHLRSLLLSEQMRERRFEEEVLTLSRSIFTSCFSSLSAKHGIDEIIRVISETLKNQDQANIIIEVPTADYQDIKAQMVNLLHMEQNRLTLRPSDDLNVGDCRIRWDNGGAFRTQSDIVEKILYHLEELLAPTAQKSQNNQMAHAQIDNDGEK